MTVDAMTAAAGFLRDILRDPADDAPRMAYADWLAERGDPRGEFIAVQLRIASVRCLCRNPDGTFNGACGFCDSNELRRREGKLLDAHGYGWSDGLAGDGWHTEGIAKVGDTVTVRYFHNGEHAGKIDLAFRRGFVAHVTLTLADFEAHAAALFAAAPIETVRLADRRPVLRYEGVCWLVPFGPGGVADCYEPEDIPRGLANALRVKEYDGSALGNVAAFRHHEDAAAWLSAACVAHGRRLAGLPPLPAAKAVAREA